MNIISGNLNILATLFVLLKNLKTRSLLYILFIINAIVFIYGLSSAKIINIGSLMFILFSVVFMYFYFKKSFQKKIISLQNLNKSDDK